MHQLENSHPLPVQSSSAKAFAPLNDERATSQDSSLSAAELIFLWLIAAICFIAVISHFRPYFAEVGAFGDNPAYLSAARAIQHWDFNGVETKQFWGLSYAVAALSSLRLSPQNSLLLICMATSLGSTLLVRNLWGAWTAAYFTLLSFYWFQASFLGSSEPLFVFLLFSSFWCIRKERWRYASLLAALATIVRPVGLFALVAIGLALIHRREYKKALHCTAIGALIGFLYLLPFWIYFHDALYQFHRYQKTDWESGFVIGWPFHAIVVSYLHNREPWTNVILTTGWLAFAVVGYLLIAVKMLRQRTARTTERTFAIGYLSFFFSYNSVYWARAEFPRFVFPVLPILLVAFDRWVPKSRILLYSLAVVSPVLGACSEIGIRSVFGFLR